MKTRYGIKLASRMGEQFSAFLYKNNENDELVKIGGLVNGQKNFYVNLRKKLTVLEMKELFIFIENLGDFLNDTEVHVVHMDEEMQ